MFQDIVFPNEVSGFNVFDMMIETDPGVKVLFKPNDLGSEEEILIADESGLIHYVKQMPTAEKLIFFVNPGGETPISGTLKVTQAILRYIHVEVIINDPIQINDTFIGNDPGVYTMTSVTEGIQVDFSKNAGKEWSYFYRDVTEVESTGRNTLKMVFKGTPGLQIMVKPNDNGAFEGTVTLDSNGDGVFEKLITGPLTKIIVFVWPNQAGIDEAPMTGSFVITQTELRCVA